MVAMGSRRGCSQGTSPCHGASVQTKTGPVAGRACGSAPSNPYHMYQSQHAYMRVWKPGCKPSKRETSRRACAAYAIGVPDTRLRMAADDPYGSSYLYLYTRTPMHRCDMPQRRPQAADPTQGLGTVHKLAQQHNTCDVYQLCAPAWAPKLQHRSVQDLMKHVGTSPAAGTSAAMTEMVHNTSQIWHPATESVRVPGPI